MNAANSAFEGKVFGIGLGRTGSVSLARALDHLGIPTVHYPGDATKKELLSGQFELGILRKYRGLVDGIHPFYRQLDRCYPDSKFILTVREVEAYVRSRLKLKKFLNVLRPKMSSFQRAYHGYLELTGFGKIDPGEMLIRDGFERHVRDVTEYFRNRHGKLLVMDIPGGDDWAQLCPFLSTELPDIPFPRSNSSEDMSVMTKRLDDLWNDLHRAIPPGSKFLFVDDATLGIDFAQHQSLPFPNRDGIWWGLPADSEQAIGEFEKSVEQGAQFIAFAWPSFWWFDYYNEFCTYLTDNAVEILKNESCMLFDCGRG